jgi:hypothetical protein
MYMDGGELSAKMGGSPHRGDYYLPSRRLEEWNRRNISMLFDGKKAFTNKRQLQIRPGPWQPAASVFLAYTSP